jgi:hypothetical protein
LHHLLTKGESSFFAKSRSLQSKSPIATAF